MISSEELQLDRPPLSTYSKFCGVQKINVTSKMKITIYSSKIWTSMHWGSLTKWLKYPVVKKSKKVTMIYLILHKKRKKLAKLPRRQIRNITCRCHHIAPGCVNIMQNKTETSNNSTGYTGKILKMAVFGGSPWRGVNRDIQTRMQSTAAARRRRITCLIACLRPPPCSVGRLADTQSRLKPLSKFPMLGLWGARCMPSALCHSSPTFRAAIAAC